MTAELKQLATIVESSRDAIWSWATDGTILSWNAEAERMLGYKAEEIIGKSLLTLIPPDRIEAAQGVISNVNRGQVYGPLETMRLNKNGTPVPVELTVSPIRDSRGQTTSAATICRDITERKRAQETEKTLVREVQHRSNNLLAVIQTIASRSLSGSISLGEARVAFEARLHALARANRQLVETNWSSVSLAEIVRSELQPFGDRIDIDGVNILLNPKHVQNFALALHELATNAAKHGALSNGNGKVGISWALIAHSEINTLSFQWRESGGPPVSPPTRHGFGTTLLKATFPDARIDYATEGLSCQIEITLDDRS